MAVRQRFAMNATGDIVCGGCGVPYTVMEDTGTIRDVADPDNPVEGTVEGIVLDHPDTCPEIAGIRGMHDRRPG